MRNIYGLIVDLVVAALLAAAILFFIQPTTVRQTSMEDNFHEGDYLIIAKQAYRKKAPQRGDVVVFESKLEGDEKMRKLYKGELLIKRVVGLPGDTIEFRDGYTHINGVAIEEPYAKGSTYARDNPYEEEEFVVPDGCYYVIGDNRENSADSRDSRVGYATKENLVGKVVFRVWPDPGLTEKPQ